VQQVLQLSDLRPGLVAALFGQGFFRGESVSLLLEDGALPVAVADFSAQPLARLLEGSVCPILLDQAAPQGVYTVRLGTDFGINSFHVAGVLLYRFHWQIHPA